MVSSPGSIAVKLEDESISHGDGRDGAAPRMCALCPLGEEAAGVLGELLVFVCSRKKRREEVLIHSLCAQFAPRAYYSQEPGAQHHLAMVPEEVHRARQLRCRVCDKTCAAMGCEVKECKQTFHLPCVMQQRAARFNSEAWTVYCPKHAEALCPAELESLDMRQRRRRLRFLPKPGQSPAAGGNGPPGWASPTPPQAAAQPKALAQPGEADIPPAEFDKRRQAELAARTADAPAEVPDPKRRRPGEAAGMLPPSAPSRQQQGLTAGDAPDAVAAASGGINGTTGAEGSHGTVPAAATATAADDSNGAAAGAPARGTGGGAAEISAGQDKQPQDAGLFSRVVMCEKALNAHHGSQPRTADGTAAVRQSQQQQANVRPSEGQEEANGAWRQCGEVRAFVEEVFGPSAPHLVEPIMGYLVGEGLRSFSDLRFVDHAELFATIGCTKLLFNKFVILAAERGGWYHDLQTSKGD